MTAQPDATAAARDSARSLQEGLHNLLTRLSETTNILKNWKEADADDSSIHVETTTRLIGSLQQVILAVKSVEEKVLRGDEKSEGDKRLIKAVSIDFIERWR